MKPAKSLSDRKVEIAQRLFAIEDEETLDKFEALIDNVLSHETADQEVPQHHLDSIAKGDADIAAGRIVKLEAFRQKYAHY